MENERLLFKFYKSYFDTAKMLDDKNRLKFYDALFEKQFNFIEPSLDGLANLVWVSQKHSIDAQVNGWLDKMKSMGIEPPAIPPTEPPCIQLKEKEKGKEEVKEKKEIKKQPVFDFSFVATNFKDVFSEWIDYKIQIKDGYKVQIGVEKAYKNLLKLSQGKPYIAKLIVDQSIANNWKGLFEFKGNIHQGINTTLQKVKYKIDNEVVTHTRKAYEENLSIYGKERVIFIKEVE